MAPKYSQAGRPFRVETPLPEDTLLLNGFNGIEAISQPFTFQLDLVSPKDDVDPAGLVGETMLTTVLLANGETRYIHGLVNRLAYLGKTDDLSFFRAEIVPALWRLTLTRESRMYQEKSVPDILEEVFTRTAHPDYELRLTRDYEPREYCVQYRETHFNFVSRLLEEEGIFYFFEHFEDRHVLVLCDDNGSTNPALAAEELRFAPEHATVADSVNEFEAERALHTGKITIWNYDYLQPTMKLAYSLGDELESYDYPVNYKDPDHGERAARLLLEAEEATRQVVRGASTVRGLLPGHHFKLKEHFRSDANAKYLITQVQHFANAGGYRAWDQTAALDYRNEFQAIPFGTPYRPQRRTPRPTIRGWQPAIVTGPPGSEVHCDKYGRIKVQFYWDRDGKRNEKSSCWIRVTTPWGGKGYGSVSIPRVGNEVAVAFQEGDPDMPLIIGSVYNDDQMPPYGLPNAGITMGMKSRSSPGGGGTNEITMNDTKGKELINIHAQFDMATVVEHDQRDNVNNNRTITIAVDDTESVGSNQTISIGADQAVTIDGAQTIEVGGERRLTVDKDHGVTVKGAETYTVEKDRTTKVDGKENLTVGDNRATKVEKNDDLQVEKKLSITAGEQITLQSGDASIVLKKDGTITIKGKDITIQGSGKINIKASGDVIVKGSKVKQN